MISQTLHIYGKPVFFRYLMKTRARIFLMRRITKTYQERMFTLRNLKLGKKLGLAFGIILLLTMSSGIFSVVETNSVGESFNFVTEDLLAGLFDAADILDRGNNVNYAIRGFRYTETPEMLKLAKDSLVELRHGLQTSKELEEKYPNLQLIKKFLPIIEGNIDDLISKVEKVFEYEAQKELLANKLTSLIDPVFNATQELFDGRVSASMELIDQIDSSDAYRGTLSKEDVETLKIRVGDQIALTYELLYKMFIAKEAVSYAMNNKFTPGLADTIKKEVDAIPPILKKLEESASSVAAQEAIARTEKHFNELVKTTNDYIEARDNIMNHFTEVGTAQVALKETLTQYNDELTARAEEIGENAMSSLSTMRSIIIIGIVLSVTLGFIISFFTARAISRPMTRVVGIAQRIGQGDLTIKRKDFGYEGKDEIGFLVNAFDEMVKSQVVVIRDILDIAKSIANESLNLAALSEETNASMEEIRASVDQITTLSGNNASALEESNAGIEEMSAGAATVAQSSTNGAQNANSTSEVTENAVKVVKDVISQINHVGNMSNENEKEIRELVTSVEQITGFVSVITNIADQTNLLALNAAIEAARAGEAGRGFAVVADEVRKLAEESGHAAKNISEQISGLQSSAHKAIGGTVKSVEILREILTMADKAQSGLNDGLDRMKVINDEIQNIAAIAEEQAASSKEMAGAIDLVTKGTVEVGQRISGVQNASAEASKASESVATTAQTLSGYSANMSEALAHFVIEEVSGKLAIGSR